MTRARDIADQQDNSGGAVAPFVAGKNRVINGAMTIDQRNSGSVVTINTSAATYTLDRFINFGQPTDGVYTVQRDTTAPSGFTNSLKITVTTADASIGAAQFYTLTCRIEGYNVADFAYGTASAKTATLSFWVRSSVTGTFGGSFRNGTNTRSYPFSYTINAANTWEQKSIVIAGDTTGTWDNSTATGLAFTFSLGDGVDRVGTAGAWTAGNLTGATGQTNLIATLDATWFVTGVQLELGAVATPFTTASGSIGGELALCQRYYEKSYPYANLPGSTTSQQGLVSYQAVTSTAINNRCWTPFIVSKRTDSPTITIYNYNNGASGYALNESTGVYTVAIQFQSNRGFNLYPTSGSFSAGQVCNFYYTADSEL